MSDFSWLADDARNIHNFFHSIFYLLVTLFLLIGVFLEYFKFALGGLPSFGILVGRAFIAAIMLFSFKDFLDALAMVTDSISGYISDFNEFKRVLSKMGEKLEELTWSWTSAKRMVIVTISFLTFFILYVSVYLTDALYFYSWTLLYIFSPILIALYVLPSTASATKALYRCLFIVASWKIVWSVLAALLWTSALLDLEKISGEISFLTVILLNLMLAASLLLTPLVVKALMGAGVSTLAPIGAATVASALGAGHLLKGKNLVNMVNPKKWIPKFSSQSKHRYQSKGRGRNTARKSYHQKKSTPRNKKKGSPGSHSAVDS